MQAGGDLGDLGDTACHKKRLLSAVIGRLAGALQR